LFLLEEIDGIQDRIFDNGRLLDLSFLDIICVIKPIFSVAYSLDVCVQAIDANLYLIDARLHSADLVVLTEDAGARTSEASVHPLDAGSHLVRLSVKRELGEVALPYRDLSNSKVDSKEG
jgi:hypothetical protein